MTDDERRLARALACCTFFPGSWDKRMARSLETIADNPEGGLTAKQRTWLVNLSQKYRRQLGPAWERWCVGQYGVPAKPG
jgi:hypothetical protein